MIPVQNMSYVKALRSTQATNGQTLTSSLVDMLGCKYATFIIDGTTSNNATNVPAVSILTSNATGSTTFVADAYLSGGTNANNWTIPNAPTSTSSQPWVVVHGDWRARPRYAEVQITPVTTQSFDVNVIRSRMDIAPQSASDYNVTGGVFFG
jgi:hypothetical protein